MNIEKLINWFTARKGKLTYSMTGSRNGADGTADCSGSMTEALYTASGLQYAYLYSTVTLSQYLTALGFTRISINEDWEAERGDVVLCSMASDMAGSGGAGGHVGVMENETKFISCDYWTAGQTGQAISEHYWNEYYAYEQFKYIEVWRYGNTQPQTQQPSTAIQTFKDNDNLWVNTSTYHIDGATNTELLNVKLAGGADATMEDNGIPQQYVIVKGDTFTFKPSYNNGTIDKYDPATNGVGIYFGPKLVWFDATEFLKG